MSLTWRDVAGRVEAPDFSEAGQLITRGLETVGAALRQPNQEKDAELAKQMLLLNTAAQIEDRQLQSEDRLLDRADRRETKEMIRRKEEGAKAFSTVRSTIESEARDAALAGIPYADFISKSKTYAGLDDNARSFADGILNDSYFQGVQLRDQRAERAQNNQVQMAQLELSRRSTVASERSAREASASRQLADEMSRLRLGAAKREENEIKFLASPLGKLTTRIGTNYNDATGRQYQDMAWSALAKQSGIENISEYRESLNKLNAERAKQKKPALPEGAAKALLATQVGKNTGVPGWVNEIDQGDITSQLQMVADQYDFTLREADVLVKYRNLYDAGTEFTDEQVQADLKRANPPTPLRVGPAAGAAPSTLGVWNVSHK